MSGPPPATLRVLCVDDNDFIAEAIQRKLKVTPGFEWAGWMPRAEGLAAKALELTPDIILLDVDIPGDDSFAALEALLASGSPARVIMFSGHLRVELIDKAFASGAWGYVCKNEDLATIMEAMRQVASGEFVIRPDMGAEARP